MSLFRIFGNSAANEAADRILAAAMQASRDPDLYGEGRVPDTMDGRFELAIAFAVLALLRLKAAPDADRVAQVYTDKLFRLFDAGLRESGVGDLSVARRMKALASAFYGRLAAYQAALADERHLAAALGRNIWSAETAPFAPALASRLRTLHARQAQASPQTLETADSWVLPGGSSKADVSVPSQVTGT
jgi:cytochrome b pre-mRNA-processing protein 3